MHGMPEADFWCSGGVPTRPPTMTRSAPTEDQKAMPPTCVGCERRISDQYLLRVAPDLEWHASCLKCVVCAQSLDETCTCFVRDGKTYCRRDYLSRFTTKCAGCLASFQRSDLVMRARHLIFHTDCFRCTVCERRLASGDEFALTEGDKLCCRADLDSAAITTSTGSYDVTAVTKCDASPSTTDDDATTTTTKHKFNNNNENETKTPINSFSENDSSQGFGGQSSGQNNGGSGAPAAPPPTKSGGRSRSHKSSDQKTTRIRTVLNEKQLHTLRTCYGANPRPDALMKEQLVEMTGLSPRVIRVWFQNKRCKDKKRSILLKQIQQHHQETAVSMVAASPVSHDPQSSMAPVKVHQLQLLPWPAAFIPGACDPLSAPSGSCPVVADYTGCPMDPADVQPPPPFQRLLSSFDNLSDDEEDDAVVSVDEPSSRALRQHRGYLRPGVHAGGGGSGLDRILAAGGPSRFPGAAAQQGIIC